MSESSAAQTPVATAATGLPSGVAASGVYFISHALLVAAGLISMPVLTRLLSKQEYGLLSLLSAITAILTVAGTLGFSEATLRFYDERRQRGAIALHELCDTMLGGTLATSLLVVLAAVVVARIFVAPTHPAYARGLELASVLGVFRAISGVLLQIYRVQGRAVVYAATRVLIRYGTTGLAIGLLLMFEREALTVIVAAICIEGAILAIVWLNLVTGGVLTWPRLIGPILAAANVYGIPLALAAAARFLLDFGDRFLIERFLGLNAVASYSVPYDLAQRLSDFLFAPVALAVMPIIFRLWAQDGRAAASQYASQILGNLIALAIPAGVLYLMLNDDLILLVASEKYRESMGLTPLLLPGVLLGGINFIAVAGLTIRKDTVALALNVCGATILNLGLNVILIPRWSLSGAATATSIAYGALLVSNYLRSRAVLDLRLEFRLIARTLLATGIMALALASLGQVSSRWLVNLSVRGTVGVASGAVSFWMLDPDSRGRLRRHLQRWNDSWS